MIMYYAITNYHILNCILHKLKYHPQENTTLYISKWHPEHEVLIEKIHKLNYFKDVILFEEVIFPSANNNITKEQIKQDIKYIVNNIKNIDFSKYKEINICGDHYGLGVYLVYNNISYNYFEDGCGILSTEELLMSNIKKIEYSRYQILKYLKIPGKSKCVSKRFGNLEHQKSNYANKKDVHFSVSDELKKISKKDLDNIFSIFCDNYKITTYDDAALILTFHYNNLGILTLEEQRMFYGYLIDYFADNKQIVIKPHPSDLQPSYTSWFPKSHILPRKMPSEFLPTFTKKEFPIAITGWSTAIYNLSDILGNIVNFNQEIDKTYWQMNQYYLIAHIISKIYKQENSTILTRNINNKQLENLIKLFRIKNIKIEDKKNKINQQKRKKINICCINDKKAISKLTKELTEEDILICIFDNMISIEDILEISNKDILIVEIRKEKINPEEEISNIFLKEEYILCITKNKELQQIIKEINFEKNLTHTNVKLKFRTNIINIFKETLLKYNEKIENLEKEYQKVLSISKDFEQQIFDKNALIEKLKKENYEILNSSSWKLTSTYRKFGKKTKEIFKNKGCVKHND